MGLLDGYLTNGVLTGQSLDDLLSKSLNYGGEYSNLINNFSYDPILGKSNGTINPSAWMFGEGGRIVPTMGDGNDWSVLLDPNDPTGKAGSLISYAPTYDQTSYSGKDIRQDESGRYFIPGNYEGAGDTYITPTPNGSYQATETYNPDIRKYVDDMITEDNKTDWLDTVGPMLPLAFAAFMNPALLGMGGGGVGSGEVAGSAGLPMGSDALVGIPAWDSAYASALAGASGTAGAESFLDSPESFLSRFNTSYDPLDPAGYMPELASQNAAPVADANLSWVKPGTATNLNGTNYLGTPFSGSPISLGEGTSSDWYMKALNSLSDKSTVSNLASALKNFTTTPETALIGGSGIGGSSGQSGAVNSSANAQSNQLLELPSMNLQETPQPQAQMPHIGFIDPSSANNTFLQAGSTWNPAMAAALRK